MFHLHLPRPHKHFNDTNHHLDKVNNFGRVELVAELIMANLIYHT